MGVSDEQTTCDACGKTNLKKTVVLESESAGIVRYGVDCAARALKGNNKKSTRDIIELRAKYTQLIQKKLTEGMTPSDVAKSLYERHGCGYSVGADKAINTVAIQFETGTITKITANTVTEFKY